ASELGYAPLPKQLRPWIEARLKTITSGGKSVWTTAARAPLLPAAVFTPRPAVFAGGGFSYPLPLHSRDKRRIRFRAHDCPPHRARRHRRPGATLAPAARRQRGRPRLPGRADGPGGHPAA